MNCNGITKLSILCLSLFINSGCAYHNAMNAQEQRQAIIAANLVQENNVTTKQEIEKLKLEKELVSLKSEISSIDQEIAKIRAKTEKVNLENKKRAQKDYRNQLAMLEKSKAHLQKSLNEKIAIIELL